MNQLEAIASFRDTADHIRKQIADLESYFAVTCIDAWPYVVILESEWATPSALKVVDAKLGSYNFSATGREAQQYSKARAIEVAKAVSTPERKASPMGKYDFFKMRLESARGTLKDFETWIADAEAKQAEEARAE
jgi:hypothetical protein